MVLWQRSVERMNALQADAAIEAERRRIAMDIHDSVLSRLTALSRRVEYAELLAEKKAAYADYRKAREKMKELLTAKANIDRILELDKELEEANERREKEAEQR